MLLAITGLVRLQTFVTGQERRFVTVGGRATRGRVLALGAMRWPLALAIWAYVLVGVILVGRIRDRRESARHRSPAMWRARCPVEELRSPEAAGAGLRRRGAVRW